MRKIFFALAFMLVGIFAFATNEDYTSINEETENFYHFSGVSHLVIDTKFENLSSNSFATCEIEIDLINGSTGEVVGTVVFNIEVSGGTPSSQQSACEWTGAFLTALLNSGIQ